MVERVIWQLLSQLGCKPWNQHLITTLFSCCNFHSVPVADKFEPSNLGSPVDCSTYCTTSALQHFFTSNLYFINKTTSRMICRQSYALQHFSLPAKLGRHCKKNLVPCAVERDNLQLFCCEWGCLALPWNGMLFQLLQKVWGFCSNRLVIMILDRFCCSSFKKKKDCCFKEADRSCVRLRLLGSASKWYAFFFFKGSDAFVRTG